MDEENAPLSVPMIESRDSVDVAGFDGGSLTMERFNPHVWRIDSPILGRTCIPPHIMEMTLTPVQLLLYLTGVAAIAGSLGIIAMLTSSSDWDRLASPIDTLAHILLYLPLVTLLLGLGFPPAMRGFKKWNAQVWWAPWFIASIIPVCYIVAALMQGDFNLLTIFIIGGITFLSRFSGVEHEAMTSMIFSDILMWYPLFLILDLRWYEVRLLHVDLVNGYDWWALFISTVFVLWAGTARCLPNFGYNLVPTLRDWALIGIGALLLMVPIIPIGLLSGFLTFPPSETPTAALVFSGWMENFLTVSLTEELLFRCLFYGAVQTKFEPRRWWIPALFSSFLFGIWHWPRMDEPLMLFLYIVFAAMNGFVECFIYRWSGMNIIGGAILHSTVDVIWGSLLS